MMEYREAKQPEMKLREVLAAVVNGGWKVIIWGLVAALLFGVFGMIVMIPIASVIYTLLSEATEKRLQKRNVANEKLVAQPPEIAKNKKEKKLIPAEDAEE